MAWIQLFVANEITDRQAKSYSNQQRGTNVQANNKLPQPKTAERQNPPATCALTEQSLQPKAKWCCAEIQVYCHVLSDYKYITAVIKNLNGCGINYKNSETSTGRRLFWKVSVH